MRIYFYFPLGISYTLKLIAIASTAAVDGDRAKELITDDDDDDDTMCFDKGSRADIKKWTEEVHCTIDILHL